MTGLRGGLIQMSLKADTSKSPEKIRDADGGGAPAAHRRRREKGVKVLCLQEVFTQPYFCPSQDAKW